MFRNPIVVTTADSKKLIVALDLPSGPEAVALAEQLKPLGVTYKIGMQLFYKEGMPTVKAIQGLGGPVFLDLKLHDIPNTVARATESLVGHGVKFFNVHASGGPEMMRAAHEAALKTADEKGLPKPMVIAVTLLTSLSQAQLKEALHVHDTVENYVVHLAKQAKDCGLAGVVCSAHEAPLIREACGKDFVLVTPGIRPQGAAKNDQARVLTPTEAIQAGADYLVVGRPIVQAENPVTAAKAILDEMAPVMA